MEINPSGLLLLIRYFGQITLQSDDKWAVHHISQLQEPILSFLSILQSLTISYPLPKQFFQQPILLHATLLLFKNDSHTSPNFIRRFMKPESKLLSTSKQNMQIPSRIITFCLVTLYLFIIPKSRSHLIERCTLVTLDPSLSSPETEVVPIYLLNSTVLFSIVLSLHFVLFHISHVQRSTYHPSKNSLMFRRNVYKSFTILQYLIPKENWTMRLIALTTLKKISTSQDFSREERKFPNLFYLSLSLLMICVAWG